MNDENNYDEFDFDDLFSNFINQSEKEFGNEEKFDDTVKVIGDRIKIINYSRVSLLNGLPLDDVDFNELTQLIFFVDYLIVVETNCNVFYANRNRVHKQDLVIVNPKNNNFYRINSRHVAIYQVDRKY